MTVVTNLTKTSSSYKLVIPKDVEEKIDIWCREVPDNEWSGILYYTAKGSFENEDLELTCRDFLVLDIGTMGHTEYDHTSEIIEYADKNGLLECYQGNIHSHDHLKVFFSAEDDNTLRERGMQMPHFLSLIVNNAGEHVAKITRRLQYDSCTYPTFNGGNVPYKKDHSEIICHDLNIITKENFVLEEIRDRKDSLLKAKRQAGQLLPQQNLFSPPPHFSWKTDFSKEEGVRIYPADESAEDPDIDHMFMQLVTGSVLVRKDKSFDINSWIKNSMEKAYRNRFPDEDSMFEWFESYISWMVWDSKYNIGNDDITADSLKLSLYEKCESYKSNSIIKTIQKVLNEI